MAAVKTYKVTPLKQDDKLIVKVMDRRGKGESAAVIAKALKLGLGKVLMCEIISNTDRVTVADPAKLARALVKDRKAGASWPQLAAKYGIAEGCTHRAYEAATGQPYTTTDYRRGSRNGKESA
jgi:hypothetical protein